MTFNEENVPIKGKHTALFVCWILGNGSLFAWNSMLTTLDYYITIFPHYHPSRVLTIAYQPFALGTTAIMTYHEAKMNTRLRNLVGFSLFAISSVVVLVLNLVSSGKGGILIYILMCGASAAFGVADGLVQGGMVGDLSFMSPKCIQSFMAGLAASGAITSGLRLLTKAAFEDSKGGLRKGALLFLAISAAFELACFFIYKYLFPKLPMIRYYRSKAAAEGSKTVSADLAAAGIQVQTNPSDEGDPKRLERLSTKQLLSQNVDYAIGIFLIYALTLSIFPGFLNEDTGSHSLGSWYSLVLTAMYNVLDLIGRYIPLIKCLRIESRIGLMLSILARYLLIPAFYFTAKYGDQGWMIILTSFLGVTNGHLTVCILMAAPRGYKGPEQNALGNVLVLFLIGGLLAGLSLGWLWLIGKGW
ncbi:hypothetical protein AAC387_Pa06g3115 [Persea americana]